MGFGLFIPLTRLPCGQAPSPSRGEGTGKLRHGLF